LRYVKNAVAVTDVPDELCGLIKQRRRWLNGSFFAMVYAIINFKHFFNTSSHELFRKLLITFQFFYYGFSTVMAWFMLANFYLAFLVLVQGMLVADINDDDNSVGVLRRPKATYPYAVRLLTSTYNFLLGIVVILSLGNKPQNVKAILTLAALLFAGLAGVTYYLAVEYATNSDAVTLGAAASSFLVYFLAGLCHGELGYLVISFVQYMLLLPTYINVLMIYAFCNTHDLSWGTKGIDSAHGVQAEAAKKNREDRKVSQATLDYRLQEARAELKEKKATFVRESHKRDELQEFRSILLIGWLASNSAAVTAVSSVFDYDASGNSQGHIIADPKDYMKGLFFATSFFNVVRFVGSTVFLLLRLIPSFSGRGERLQVQVRVQVQVHVFCT
jgi:chitin synthase